MNRHVILMVSILFAIGAIAGALAGTNVILLLAKAYFSGLIFALIGVSIFLIVKLLRE